MAELLDHPPEQACSAHARCPPREEPRALAARAPKSASLPGQLRASKRAAGCPWPGGYIAPLPGDPTASSSVCSAAFMFRASLVRRPRQISCPSVPNWKRRIEFRWE